MDFTLFRSQTFLGTNAIAFIVSFAMLAMFFFTALYMQNILGYSAIEAGVRFLPSTLMIVLIAPLAGQAHRPDRAAAAARDRPDARDRSRCSCRRASTCDTGYGLLLPAFVLMGIGMALTMSPMSTAAMNAVAAQKAGVASGILSMSRMVGGTFGVAALGALFHAPRPQRAVRFAGRHRDRRGPAGAARERASGTASDGGEPAARGRRRGAQRVHPRARQRHVALGGRGRGSAWCSPSRWSATKPVHQPRRRRTAAGGRGRPRPSKRPRLPSRSTVICRPLWRWMSRRSRRSTSSPAQLPGTMAAWVIREEREGEPKDAFQLEEIEVPEPGAFEVIVRVMAAGVNYNNVWAALGEPVGGVALRRPPRVRPPHRRLGRLGRRLEGRRGRDALEARRRGRHPLQHRLLRGPRGARARPARRAQPEDLGLRDHLGLVRAVHQGPGPAAPAEAARRSPGTRRPRTGSSTSPPTGC